ncbi:hypothetical protein Celaphus_00009843, partial [Cervus elaphus hippelaphus]
MMILLKNLKVQSMWSLRERASHLQNLLPCLSRRMMKEFFFPLLPSPSTAFAGNIFSPESMPTPHLSSIQKGILQEQGERDLEAFRIAFPVSIHERIAPGVDPNNPNGVYKAGPKESYTEFIARLQEAIHRQGINAEATDVILQLLAYDNANTDCKKVMNPFKGKASLTDYVKLCQG